MIAVVDYGVGNLHSIRSALLNIGADAIITGDKAVLESASHIILPGVGAFGDAMQKLVDANLDECLCSISKTGKPLLGICLGMQLLFEESAEYGKHRGLGLIKGRIAPLKEQLPLGAKVPHMGWNSLQFLKEDDELLRNIHQGDAVYYVHSFYATDAENSLVATSDYLGVAVPGIVRNGNVIGMQFHPEKSGNVGLALLRNFIHMMP